MEIGKNNPRVIKGSNKARKTAARLAAVQCYYQARHNEDSILDVFDEYTQHRYGKDVDGERYVASDLNLLKKTLEFADQNTNEIAQLVNGHLSRGQALQSLDSLLQSILICATAEIWIHTEIETAIIINDYISVTKSFYDGKEYQLINGILDAAAKALRNNP